MPIDTSTMDLDLKYMGKKESGDYVYYGFKGKGGLHWQVMRKDLTNEAGWQYAFGISNWLTAWADPTILGYSDPPDA